MPTVEALKRRIDSTDQLMSVVKTMKSLAAVNIRQFEQAAEALADYAETVALGLSYVLRTGPSFAARNQRRAVSSRLGLVAVGTDQGMCGQLNEDMASAILDHLQRRSIALGDVTAAVVGERLAIQLEDGGLNVERLLEVPSSAEAISATVWTLLMRMEEWLERGDAGRVAVAHTLWSGSSVSQPTIFGLLPADRERLESTARSQEHGRGLPMHTMDRGALLASLTRQYLFINLFKALADSLAAENAARLAAMQGAEKNIDERLGELWAEFRHTRQMAITEELLDIVSGFEALE